MKNYVVFCQTIALDADTDAFVDVMDSHFIMTEPMKNAEEAAEYAHSEYTALMEGFEEDFFENPGNAGLQIKFVVSGVYAQVKYGGKHHA